MALEQPSIPLKIQFPPALMLTSKMSKVDGETEWPKNQKIKKVNEKSDDIAHLFPAL